MEGEEFFVAVGREISISAVFSVFCGQNFPQTAQIFADKPFLSFQTEFYLSMHFFYGVCTSVQPIFLPSRPATRKQYANVLM